MPVSVPEPHSKAEVLQTACRVAGRIDIGAALDGEGVEEIEIGETEVWVGGGDLLGEGIVWEGVCDLEGGWHGGLGQWG